MILLRELKEEDAPLMLEWMHDVDIQKGFRKNMMDMTIETAKSFCQNAKFSHNLLSGESLHFAIVDEKDEYLGTISLKNVDLFNKTAEYAIVVRKKTQGKKVAKTATMLLLKKAFYDYKLHKVYLSVLHYNIAAIHLYKSCGFVYEGRAREHILINGKYETLEWYSILDYEFNEENQDNHSI